MKGIINIMTDEDIQLLDKEYMYNNSSNLTTKNNTLKAIEAGSLMSIKEKKKK